MNRHQQRRNPCIKKLISFALTLILALTLLCASAFAEAIDHSGDWYADLYGFTLRLTLNPDGSYTNAIEGEDPDSGIWEMAGTNVLLDRGTSDEMVLVYDAGSDSLYADIDGEDLLFFREPPVEFEMAAPRAGIVTLEDMGGSWTTKMLCMLGTHMTPAQVQLSLDLRIDGSSAELTFIIDGEATTITAGGNFSGNALVLRMTNTETSEEYTMNVQLLADGTMSATTDMFSEEIIFVLEAA